LTSDGLISLEDESNNTVCGNSPKKKSLWDKDDDNKHSSQPLVKRSNNFLQEKSLT